MIIRQWENFQFAIFRANCKCSVRINKLEWFCRICPIVSKAAIG